MLLPFFATYAQFMYIPIPTVKTNSASVPFFLEQKKKLLIAVTRQGVMHETEVARHSPIWGCRKNYPENTVGGQGTEIHFFFITMSLLLFPAKACAFSYVV